MKNIRKIEVGQMREFYGCDGSSHKYVVLEIAANCARVLPLGGDCIVWWELEDLQNDIVVM